MLWPNTAPLAISLFCSPKRGEASMDKINGLSNHIFFIRESLNSFLDSISFKNFSASFLSVSSVSFSSITFSATSMDIATIWSFSSSLAFATSTRILFFALSKNFWLSSSAFF